MDAHGGYIKVWRKMLDSEVMQDDWLCRLWMWCILKAQWRNVNKKGVPERGQFITGRVRAAEELKVSPSKWYRGIERLSELGCIIVEANSNRTTITVCNYATYQDWAEQSEQQADSKRTASEQPSLEEEGKKERRQEADQPDCQSYTLDQLAQDAAFDEGWGTDARRTTLWRKHLGDLAANGMPLASLAEELGKSPDSEAPWEFKRRLERSLGQDDQFAGLRSFVAKGEGG